MGKLLVFCGVPLVFYHLCIRFYHALFGFESAIFEVFPSPLLFRFSLGRGHCGLLLCLAVFIEPGRVPLCPHPLPKLGIGQASRFVAALRRKLLQQFRPALARSGLRRGSGGCPCTFRRTSGVLRVRKGRHRGRRGNKGFPYGGLRIHGRHKRLRIAWRNRRLLHAGFSTPGPRRQRIWRGHPQGFGLGHGVGARRGLRVGDLRLRGNGDGSDGIGRSYGERHRLLPHLAQHAPAYGIALPHARHRPI